VVPLSASNRPRVFPIWVFACGILVAATIAGVGVSTLRDRADDARQKQLVFERLRALVNEQSSLELEAVVAPNARNQLARVIRSKRQAVEGALGELPHEAAAPVEGALTAYQDAVDQELRLLAQKRDDAANAIGEKRVDPSLERLRLALDEASAASSREAASAGLQANAGAGLILALAAIFSVLLFRAFHRTRRSLENAEERALRESERWFRSLVQEATELIVVVDPDTTVRYLTDSITSLLGYHPENILGKKLVELAHPDDVRHLQKVAASEPNRHAFECRLWSRAGAWIFMEWVQGTRPDAPGCILTGRDVSERKKLEQELRHQAFHDSLTGLANRALFEDRLAHALAGLQRRDVGLAVLFVDLDDFKTVNDSLGHSSGDDLLRSVGERLRYNLRGSDTAARLGGDEFGVLLEGAETPEAATEAARRLLNALEPPFTIDGRLLNVSASVGIALAARGQETMEELMRNADLAMYDAKRRGGAQWRVFEQAMHAVALGRLELGAELQRAVDEEQFELHFQPIVRLDTAAVIGAEALIRWQHPERGLLSPAHFLPLAEQTGLIVPMGRWALADACRRLADWQERYPRSEPLYLSVNVSMRQLHDSNVVDDVRAALDDAGVEPQQLVLEITESFLADETEAVLRCLQRLRALGVRLAVDDFGTGYSALSYLQRFPIDMLKIDRSFVEHARRASPSLNLVRSIVQLGRSLHLDIVAEGIEEAEQAEELLAMGVASGQGFHYAEPLVPDRLAALLATDARRLPSVAVDSFRPA
jgi:diguanylate cyclase (GGDEF)-like protein/PAS domain S-box-containing protein